MSNFIVCCLHKHLSHFYSLLLLFFIFQFLNQKHILNLSILIFHFYKLRFFFFYFQIILFIFINIFLFVNQSFFFIIIFIFAYLLKYLFFIYFFIFMDKPTLGNFTVLTIVFLVINYISN